MADGEALVQRDWRLWRRWVLANAAGELGLGAALAAWVFLGPGVAAWAATASPWLVYACGILAGTVIEGLCVGIAQWTVLCRVLPSKAGPGWVAATTTAGFVSWSGAMLFMALSAIQAGDLPVPEVSSITQLALVMAMGAGLGLTLGLPQWLVLRRYAGQAGWWVLANVVAWSLGLPAMLAVALCIPPNASRLAVALAMLLGSVVAGAAVGAVHGLELMSVLLRRFRRQEDV